MSKSKVEKKRFFFSPDKSKENFLWELKNKRQKNSVTVHAFQLRLLLLTNVTVFLFIISNFKLISIYVRKTMFRSYECMYKFLSLMFFFLKIFNNLLKEYEIYSYFFFFCLLRLEDMAHAMSFHKWSSIWKIVDQQGRRASAKIIMLI